MTARIVCNDRIMASPVTGVQRYLGEILRRTGEAIDTVAPARPLSGAKAHLWDQAVLPSKLLGRLLWSPSNSGPLAVRRQVLTIHDTISLDHPEWISGLNARWYRAMQPSLIRRVAHIIAVSEFTRQSVIHWSGVCEDKVTVIPSGVDGRFQPTGPAAADEVRTRLNLPVERYFLSNCSLEPRKNLAGLFASWSAAQPSLPNDVWLYISGGFGASTTFGVYDLPPLPPRVRLLGRVHDDILPALMSGATGFLYLSLYEGFGLPPIEAMACGTPAIVSDLTAIPEVVGDAALRVEPTSIADVAALIVAVAHDEALRADYRARGLARARRFDWDDCAGRTLNLLETVAIEPQPRG